MATLKELQEKLRARTQELNEQFDQAAACFFPFPDPVGALAVLTPICRPDHHLDVMRAGAALMRLMQVEPTRVLLIDRLRTQLQTDPDRGVADCLFYLGAVEDARAYYFGGDDLVAANDVAVCEHILEHHHEAVRSLRACLDRPGEAIRGLRDCLDRPQPTPLELLPVHYNLALALLIQRRLHEALAEFKLCRGVYPHYRDVLFFIAWIKAVLSNPGGFPPRDDLATAMLIPRYTIVRAVGGSA